MKELKLMKCPQCAEHGIKTDLEPFGEVDIGVGVQQFGPWGCPVCHWYEGQTNDESPEAGAVVGDYWTCGECSTRHHWTVAHCNCYL